MKRFLSLFLLTLAMGMFAACGDNADKGHDDDDHGHSHDDDHDHDGDDHDGDDHDDHDGDHDHDDDHGHDHEGGDHDHDDDGHGERHELGFAQAGAFKVTLVLFGDIEAGKEAVLDIDVAGGKVAAVRAWIGVESGAGSMKAKLGRERGAYHGHAEVPAKLADGSAVWVQVEDADGKRTATSFKLP